MANVPGTWTMELVVIGVDNNEPGKAWSCTGDPSICTCRTMI
jgi:hypothetical protein